MEFEAKGKMCVPYACFIYILKVNFFESITFVEKILKHSKAGVLKLTMLSVNILFIPKPEFIILYYLFVPLLFIISYTLLSFYFPGFQISKICLSCF